MKRGPRIFVKEGDEGAHFTNMSVNRSRILTKNECEARILVNMSVDHRHIRKIICKKEGRRLMSVAKSVD